MLFDEDFLVRQLRQLTQAVAALASRVVGVEAPHDLDEVEGIYAQVLGPNRSFLDTLDSRSLARLIGSAALVRVLAKTCAIEAQLRESNGDPRDMIDARRRRAIALLEEAHREAPEEGDEALLASWRAASGALR